MVIKEVTRRTLEGTINNLSCQINNDSKTIIFVSNCLCLLIIAMLIKNIIKQLQGDVIPKATHPFKKQYCNKKKTASIKLGVKQIDVKYSYSYYYLSQHFK